MVDVSNGTHVDVPVGEYGEELARAQVRAARALQEVVSTRMDLRSIDDRHAHVLEDWTFQRRPSARSLLEGVTSIAHATAVTMQQRIPGFDEFQLLAALGESHVFDRLAKGPMGFIAPIARSARRVVDPLEVDARGAVRVGPGLEQLLRETFEIRGTVAPPARSTRAGCPVTLANREVVLADGTTVRHERTMLSELAREYVDLVARFLQAERDGVL